MACPQTLDETCGREIRGKISDLQDVDLDPKCPRWGSSLWVRVSALMHQSRFIGLFQLSLEWARKMVGEGLVTNESL